MSLWHPTKPAYPIADNAYNLGSPSLRWRNLYLSGYANIGDIYMLRRLPYDSITLSDTLFTWDYWTANTLYAVKTSAADILYITGFKIYLGSALTGKIRLGLYRDMDGDGYPDKLLFDLGELVNPGTGWQGLSVPSPNCVLSWVDDPKPLWFAWVSNASPGIYLRATSGGIKVAYTYGALPDPFPSGGVGAWATSIQQAGLLGRIVK
jgi:hypothetical protein